MALVKLLTGYPIFGPGYAIDAALDGTIAPPTATAITVSNAPGYTVIFKGEFTVSGGAVTGGTMTGYEVYAGDTLLATGEDYAIDAAQLYAALQNYDTDPEPLGELISETVPTKYVGSNLVDVVHAGRAGDKLIGKAADDILTGDVGNDLIRGGKGADDIYGDLGFDTLYGGKGKDIFVFDLDPANPPVDFDRIKDFQDGKDTIGLLDQTGLMAPGYLGKAFFHKGTEATTDEQVIIYDKKTGKIFYDVDGTGDTAQFLLAKVNAGTKVHADDFFVYPILPTV